MAELLLELFSEEIPARMQARAADDLKRLVTEKLKEAGLTFTTAAAYATPRRLALVIDGLPLAQPDVTEEKRGPRVGAPEQAIQGFLKSAGLTSLDQCEKRDTGKGEFWFAVASKKGKRTAEVLEEIAEKTIWDFPWPKTMRWAYNDLRWVRPLQGLLAIFDGEPLRSSFQIIYASNPHRKLFGPESIGSITIEPVNTTRGHRFLAPQEIKVANFLDYKTKLLRARVILHPTERRTAIMQRAEGLAKAEGLSVKPDEALLDEVTGLVEWPVVLMGRIDQAFMDIPPEVLTTTMRTNQKYFSLLDKDGTLAPRFLIVANMETADKGRAIVAGNERVLRARLSDAKFFWDQDRKMKLEERVPALKEIIFHAKLGTMADKVLRVQKLAAELVPHIPGADVDQARNAALLAKADLTSGMVGEFPELQGVMGRYYALHEGEKPAVANAIAEHYAPLGPNDRCPTAPISVAVALADKIDSLVGFFAIDEKPTGSKDPFALRRAALGIIRLTVENHLRLRLSYVTKRAFEFFPSNVRHNVKLEAHTPRVTVVVDEGQVDEAASEDATRAGILARSLVEFLADRLKVALREKGVRHDLISAVFALGEEDDLVRLLARVDALKLFLESEDGANLLTAYKRASNIVRIEEKKDGRHYDGGVEPVLLRESEEKELLAALATSSAAIEAALRTENFAVAMTAMARLRRPVDAFFDKVTVNADDAELRANRLRLLSQIRATLGQVADFSEIEG